PPKDALIAGGYVNSYPKNAFMSPGDGVGTIIRWIGEPGPDGDVGVGTADPRFGYNAEIMGNCLDDPRYLWVRENGTFGLSRIRYMLPKEAAGSSRYPAPSYSPISPFYSMGGYAEWARPGPDGSQSTTPGNRDKLQVGWWPGQFFYRSFGDLVIPQSVTLGLGSTDAIDIIWDFRISAINMYMLGAYGSLQTKGQDVIRLTDLRTGPTSGANPINNRGGWQDNVQYKAHPDFGFTGNPNDDYGTINFSGPEVLGGGSQEAMPVFPPYHPKTTDVIFGAPDGYQDGIVMTLNSGSDGGNANP
ncbi:MAG TPA: hypothetical protein VEI97_19325, partial [bacterium]|nr:hypothetical protein [bacterium]